MSDPNQLKQDWDSRGYTFGIFKDPPEQVWADFVHKTDELVVLAEGEIEIEIEGKSQRPRKCLIPRFPESLNLNMESRFTEHLFLKSSKISISGKEKREIVREENPQ